MTPEAWLGVTPMDEDLVVCRCEEVSRAEIEEAIRSGARTLTGIKRRTRACMGLCQGKTCQRLVSQILQQQVGLKADEIAPPVSRPPCRPVTMKVLAGRDDSGSRKG